MLGAQSVDLDTLTVLHVNAEGETCQGVIICNKAIADDLRDIFAELYRQKYPIESIRPISEYGNDDERSMQANNTSCYCYRAIAGTTRLSKHAQGMAIDINPLYNPCVKQNKDLAPEEIFTSAATYPLRVAPYSVMPLASAVKQTGFSVSSGSPVSHTFSGTSSFLPQEKRMRAIRIT